MKNEHLLYNLLCLYVFLHNLDILVNLCKLKDLDNQLYEYKTHHIYFVSKEFLINKDDNIHKGEALKSEGRTNEHLSFVECQNLVCKKFAFKNSNLVLLFTKFEVL